MIEDYRTHQPEAEDDETPKNKRRFLKGNFLRSWLSQKAEKKQEDKEQEQDEEPKDSEKWLPTTLSKRFKEFFRSVVGLDLLAEPAKPNTDTADDTQARERYELPAAERKELTDSSPEVSEEDEEELSKAVQQRPDGLLVVPHDSSDWYGRHFEEPPDNSDELTDETWNSTLPVPVGVAESTIPPEIYTVAPEQKLGRPTYNKAASSAGEILKKEKEALIKHRMEQLKGEAQTIKTEQKALEHQQKEFEERIGRQEKFNEEIKREQIPRIDKLESADDHVNTPMPATPERRVVDRPNALPAKAPEINLREPTKEINTTRSNRYPEQMAETLPVVRPEAALDGMQRAVEQDLPTESLREQRHEIKEIRPNANGSGSAGIAAGLPEAGPNFVYPSRSKDLNQFAGSRPASPPAVGTEVGTDMYRQAMKSGFWTAMGLMLLLGVLVLIY